MDKKITHGAWNFAPRALRLVLRAFSHVSVRLAYFQPRLVQRFAMHVLLNVNASRMTKRCNVAPAYAGSPRVPAESLRKPGVDFARDSIR